MPSKYEITRNAAQWLKTEVLSSQGKYLSFLRTAARNYKYSFVEQLLIHEQKPDATACAGIDVWNKLGRWVNKGTHGIALLDTSTPQHRLRYVFDISDTNSYAGRHVRLWNVRPRHEAAIMEALSDSYHIPPEQGQTFPAFLLSAADVLVEDNYTDYYRDLMGSKTGSLLEELDELNTEQELKRTAKSAVAYMLLVRCGCDYADYENDLDFSCIRDFDTPEAASILGSAVSDISEMALREIAATVRAQDRASARTPAAQVEKNKPFIDRYYVVEDLNAAPLKVVNYSDREAALAAYTALPSDRLKAFGVVNSKEMPGSLDFLHCVDGRDILIEDYLRNDDASWRNPEIETLVVRLKERQNRTFARTPEMGYDEPARTDERSTNHDLHETGRLSDPRSGSAGDAEDRQVRDDAAQLSEGSSPGDLRRDAPAGDAERASGTDRPAGERDDGPADGADGEGPGRNGAAQGQGSDGLGGSDEQHPGGSGGDRDTGSDLRVALLPTEEEQRDNIAQAEAEQASAFSISQEDIDAVLLRGSGVSEGKMRIYAQFGKNETPEDNARFLKKEYGIGGTYPAVPGKPISEDHDTKGILIRYGSLTNPDSEVRLSWKKAEKRIRQLILDDRYLNTAEKDYFLEWEQQKIETKRLEQTPSQPKEYRFALGDTVYLGAQEYEILSLGEDTVRLYDPTFPLINKELSRDEYDRMVAENPLNDRYAVVVSEESPAEEQTKEEAPDDRVDEMLRQAELAAELSEQTGQNVFVFEEGNPEPVNLPQEPALAPPAPVRRQKLAPTVLHPEIKDAERHDYRIRDDDIGVGTPTERYGCNIDAIRVLKQLEAEDRLATPEEQDVLARYVGWGGLSSCFEESSSHYLELKNLLTEEAYSAARESTLTAFYTPPVVIRSIYRAMEQMGFRRGNILEPSCGVGSFLGMLPDSMRDSRLYGVELDSISGRIARQLYQSASIAVQGFETTELPDSFFDAAVGNVPFGQFKVSDKRYDKHNFLIHDYFFAKALDKVRPGGIIAFVTSKGTMDKENPAVRRYIAQRADLLGAIRLPNDTFKRAAGTDVTSDILFLQKRDRLIDREPDWVHLGVDENGMKMNQYFADNPDMILGEMQMISGPFGPESACVPYADQSLDDLLTAAVQNIHADYTAIDLEEVTDEEADASIPADPSVRNFSFTLVDGKLYYRQNSVMNPVDVSLTAQNRIKGMITIRDSVRRLIEYQTEDYPDSSIRDEQATLNRLYDDFVKSYGNLNSRANRSAFSDDSSACLLSSLEILDDEGVFVRKADMFSKRTIKQRVVVTSVDTASEALALSLAEKARVDMEYMSALTGKTEQEIAEDLQGVIFLNPLHEYNRSEAKYLPADEYLSGNVREKLRQARQSAELSPADYKVNVEALERVQPTDLTAAEISVRLGATWLPPEVVQQFMFQLFSTPRYCQWNMHVQFSKYTGEWYIEGKNRDDRNIKVHSTYGTSRINGYKILEQTLNLKDVRIFDYIPDENGRKTAVLNRQETAIAQGKQALIKQAFADWIWADPQRRETLCKLYNEQFNAIRPREYDGSHLNFVGMNPEITLRPHQINAIAHILYGGNTLLAHVVGAGKTYEMVAAAQESKRLGLCHKSLFVVPNHLTEQWSSEYLQLYPAANILVATKKDFEAKNRKRFCARIATGDYDSIIIGHSQFEKIPMSVERQQQSLQQQIDEIIEGIKELKQNRGDSFSVKQLEKSKKSVELRLKKLNDQSRKDDVVTFEELGVDRLFVDEAHGFKNLAAFTKMRNVGGISQTEAQKSSDLYMKCRYLDELTSGRGVVFATGTPISNSMVEMYTMQKYLQYGTLQRYGLTHFDAWASTFGETVTAIELAPEGTGYRSKTRFARFYNLPELMAMFKETADIQTADMLQLPVPKANYHNVVLKPSETQREMVAALSERAEKVRSKMVRSDVDNMLLITNDGRKLALDQRLMNDMLPDHESSKVSACAENVFEIWQRTAEQRSTQMVFCDLSTPHNDGSFNVYDDLKKKLMAKGVPEEEIAFIHSAGTEAQKKELFGKVRSGQIRILMGSTQKMGAGTNVQSKLIALHHCDCPWRPADLAQREGRIIRQGNENPEVEIYTYVTENTFDSYLYQLVENKQKFIGQIMTSKSPVRSAEDIDEQALSYAEIKALCTGNPHIKEKMDLDIEVSRLKLLKANHLSQRYALEDQIIHQFPKEIRNLEQREEGYTYDIQRVDVSTHPNKDGFSPMEIEGAVYAEKKAAGSAILEACRAMKSPDPVPLGRYRGFAMELYFDPLSREYKITLIGSIRHTATLGTDLYGNIQRLDNTIESLPSRLQNTQDHLANTRRQLEEAKSAVDKPFPYEEDLTTKSARLAELNALLDMNRSENEIVDTEPVTEESRLAQIRSQER